MHCLLELIGAHAAFLILITCMQMQVAWAMAWVVWGAWGVWVEAWGVWLQRTVTLLVMVTSQATTSSRRQGKTLEAAWVGPMAHKPKEGLGARGVGTVSKGVGAMEDKLVAEVQAPVAILATGLTNDAAAPGKHPILTFVALAGLMLERVSAPGCLACSAHAIQSELQVAQVRHATLRHRCMHANICQQHRLHACGRQH